MHPQEGVRYKETVVSEHSSAVDKWNHSDFDSMNRKQSTTLPKPVKLQEAHKPKNILSVQIGFDGAYNNTKLDTLQVVVY